MDLEELKEKVAKDTFGITKKQAHELNICIACFKKPVLTNELDEDEYHITGLCPGCFDDITGFGV